MVGKCDHVPAGKEWVCIKGQVFAGRRGYAMYGRHVPPPPKPPLTRYVRDDCDAICSKCGSSMMRRFWLFGPLKCIHPECGYVRK